MIDSPPLLGVLMVWAEGEGVPLVLFAVPNERAERNDYEIAIPKLGSLILTHTLDGDIQPLTAVPRDERRKLGLFGCPVGCRREVRGKACGADEGQVISCQIAGGDAGAGLGGEAVNDALAKAARHALAVRTDAGGDVDPVAEADVYLAYGRDLQAEEILKEAVRHNPARVSAEAYRQRVRAKRFGQRWPGVVVFDAEN